MNLLTVRQPRFFVIVPVPSREKAHAASSLRASRRKEWTDRLLHHRRLFGVPTWPPCSAAPATPSVSCSAGQPGCPARQSRAQATPRWLGLAGGLLLCYERTPSSAPQSPGPHQPGPGPLGPRWCGLRRTRCPIPLAKGSARPDATPPESKRARRASATAWYGTCGVLGTGGSAFPAEILAPQDCQGRPRIQDCTCCQGCRSVGVTTTAGRRRANAVIPP